MTHAVFTKHSKYPHILFPFENIYLSLYRKPSATIPSFSSRLY